jgi:peroxiredoxin
MVTTLISMGRSPRGNHLPFFKVEALIGGSFIFSFDSNPGNLIIMNTHLSLSLLAAVIFASHGSLRGGEAPEAGTKPQKTMFNGAEFAPRKVGEKLPAATLRNESGEPVAIKDLIIGKKPAVLVFYRGGWCPFCTKHLSALAEIQDQIIESGYRLIGISPDQPSKLKTTPGYDKLKYTLLSDSDMELSSALGISFRLDDETFTKYKEKYNIDIEADSGKDHHLLPHPSVFVIDRKGEIRFAHVNPDYKHRLDPEKLLLVLKSHKP